MDGLCGSFLHDSALYLQSECTLAARRGTGMTKYGSAWIDWDAPPVGDCLIQSLGGERATRHCLVFDTSNNQPSFVTPCSHAARCICYTLHVSTLHCEVPRPNNPAPLYRALWLAFPPAETAHSTHVRSHGSTLNTLSEAYCSSARWSIRYLHHRRTLS